MKYVYQSDKGKIRQLNEDAVTVIPRKEALLAVVADGMGGHQAGDIASKLTIEQLEKLWTNADVHELDFKKWLASSIKEVNNLVYQKAQSDSSYQGMGTTVVAAVCTEKDLIIGHIGDSRAYLISKAEWKQVTEDHSLVGELVRSGQLSKEDAQLHPKRNVILKALGTEPDLEPDIFHSDWEGFDRLLICSDGLTNKVSDQELHDVICDTSLDNLGQTLVDLANERGGEDNITLAIVDQQEEVGDV
ncbi:Stp1/IreP family PP2C-type Ser/Thr phosphatase [Gracilibacillus caseinilyticus]|uniref:Stp1/IreP family PP2C-type Ser/Thr phosphatase n=1 Tax=Gracilibacillus caseinilyticus TaxID=2932256 RepID=A0ABY4F0G5_9BACI|nr:Stp1/IreP family PP2C-type Ser/Thr phosphatase [Gracilibacillus caseinilyticus]UOQ47921.1 Stp1/IreP family PP2C-type Ser/Thr phosphatase [Gracilibacillus caseinilyticus]